MKKRYIFLLLILFLPLVKSVPYIIPISPLPYGNYSSTFFANVTVTDNQSTINTITFHVSCGYGTARTATREGNSSNFIYLFNLSYFPTLPSECNFIVSVEDSIGNITNKWLPIFIDNEMPIANITCDKTSMNVNDIITCSCNVKDTFSGVEFVTYTANPTTSSTGTFATSCIATDYAGNNATSTFNYTVSLSPVQNATERISILESWKETIDSWKSTITEAIATITTKLNGLVTRLDNIESRVSTLENKPAGNQSFPNYFKYMSSGEKKDLLCGYALENNLTSYSDLGLSCNITYRKSWTGKISTNCRCK